MVLGWLGRALGAIEGERITMDRGKTCAKQTKCAREKDKIKTTLQSSHLPFLLAPEIMIHHTSH